MSVIVLSQVLKSARIGIKRMNRPFDSIKQEADMIKVLSICLEDILAENQDERYLCCTVKRGRAGGLSVDNKGTTQWMVDDSPAFQLFFTREDTLGLYRLHNGAAVQVRRGRRTLDAPFEKPVILRHRDELVIAGRHYRVHVHGEVTKARAPYFFNQQLQKASNVAAAVVLGAALTAGACREADDSRDPPVTDTCTDIETDTEPEAEPGTEAYFDIDSDFDTDTDTDSDSDSDTIDVRLTPPD
jgi:hypothetical protein